MRVHFFLYNDGDLAECFNDHFNIYCSSEFLKLLNINNDESAVIHHILKEGETRYVYCCFKNYAELKIKKKKDCYSVYTVASVLKSLGVKVEIENVGSDDNVDVGGNKSVGNEDTFNKKNSISLDVTIEKRQQFIPVKDMELHIIHTTYDYNKKLLNDYYSEVTNDMARHFWDNLKNKNMDTYLNLSLLNLCLFEHNVIKMNVLGVAMYLLVKRISTRLKKEKKQTGSQNVYVPYVTHNTKIILKDIRGKEEKNHEEQTDVEANVDADVKADAKADAKANEKHLRENQIKEKRGLNKIGGYKKIKEEIYYYLLLPLIYKNVYDKFHIDINRGILLHGPPGCGKTFIALAIKEELAILQKKINQLKAEHEIVSHEDEQEWQKEHNQIYKENVDLKLPEMEVIKSTDLIDGNNSGEKINELFFRCCKRFQQEGRCSIIFIDEIEILCEKRENENINLYTTTLLNNMDGVKKNVHTVLIGATNFINKIDLALRRSGRFDREIEIGIPNQKDRIQILQKKLNTVTHNLTPKKVQRVADLCQSFTCSDITALVNIAMYANLKEQNVITKGLFKGKNKKNEMKWKKKKKKKEEKNKEEKKEKKKKEKEKKEKEKEKKEKEEEKEEHKDEQNDEQKDEQKDKQKDEQTDEQKDKQKDEQTDEQKDKQKDEEKKKVQDTTGQFPILLTYRHLMKALKVVKPSGMKELYVDIPQTKIKDIGGYKFVKQCIKECLIYPKKYKKIYKQYNIESPKGILLYGPPGCSKTLFAKAIASEINMNFISVKGPEIFSKYVGESEKTIRYIFKKARENNPCVIFFDEIDSIAMNRNVNQNFVSNRVLCQLLNEIDGIYSRMDVVILAATNRPDLIDPALLRPGRFDRIIYVPLPDYASRVSIFKKTLHFYKTHHMLSGSEMSCEENTIDEINQKIQMDNKLKENSEKHYFEIEQSEANYNNQFVTNEIKEYPTHNSFEDDNSSFQKNDIETMKTEGDAKKCVKKKKPSSHFVQLCRFLAKHTKQYSGAEIVNLCREASICALRETLKMKKMEKMENMGKMEKMGKLGKKEKGSAWKEMNISNDMTSHNQLIALHKRHFVKVLNKTKPQTPDSLIQFYKEYSKRK